MRTPLDPTMTVPKHKELSIHILTDQTGPHGIPLVYGSTPDRLASIKGVVRFSCHPDCRGKDIVILYEAKAEARWTALENKKLVDHNTEEILGHHIWHFPLEHTKQGGSTIVAGIYEKEIEILLAHPMDQHRLAVATSPTSSPLPSHATIPLRQQQQLHQPLQQPQQLLALPGSGLPSTAHPPVPLSPASLLATHRQTKPWALLPSSSLGPHASMRYTIRAILRRPFPNMNIEACQEIWVLHSALPPMKPSRSLSLHPRSRSAALSSTSNFPLGDSTRRRGQRSPQRSSPSHQALAKKRSATATGTETKDQGKDQSCPLDKPQSALDPEASPPTSTDPFVAPPPDPAPRSLLSIPLPSLPTKAIKSALSSLLPSIELPRLKQASDDKESDPTRTAATATTGTDAEEKQKEPTGAASTSTSSSPSPQSTHLSRQATPTTPTTSHGDLLSDDGSESSTSGHDRSIPLTHWIGEASGDDDEDEEEPQAEYTGVWEPFRIPYSCTIPSETVYLGQEVPLRIRFGPRPRSRRRSNDARAKKQSHGGGGAGTGAAQPPQDRFVVKKGLLKLMEHTILREVSVTPTTSTARPSSKKSLQNLSSFAQQQPNLPLQNNATSTSAASVSRRGSIQSVRPDSYHDQSSVKTSSHKFLWFGSNKSSVRSSRSKQGDHGGEQEVTLTGEGGVIYQEKSYSGSHSHLIDLYPTTGPATDPKVHHLSTLTPQQQQQQHQQDSSVVRRYQSNDLKRLLFKPKRHSMDHSFDLNASVTTSAAAAVPTAASQSLALSPVLRPSSPPLVHTSPLPPVPPSPSPSQLQHIKLASPPRTGATRMINSVEAKFKTEVLSMSLTSMLQQQERNYLQQREQHLRRHDRLARRRDQRSSQSRQETSKHGRGTPPSADQTFQRDQEDSDQTETEESEDGYEREEEEEEEEDVWETVVMVQIPGPSELAPETETKNISRTHTLQLMLLCGLVPISPTPTSSSPSSRRDRHEGGVQQGSDSTKPSPYSPASSPTSTTPPASLPSSPPNAHSPLPTSTNFALNDVTATMAANREFRLEMDLHVTGPRSPVLFA